MGKFWLTQIADRILERGYNYFNQGRVNKLEYQDNNGAVSVSAKVFGTDVYQVSCLLRDDRILTAQCNCAYAADGNYCKHVAAALYAYNYNKEIDEAREKRKKAEEEKNRRDGRFPVKPFQTPEGEKAYFDIGELTDSYRIYNDDYQEALQIAGDNKQSNNISCYYDTESSYKGLIVAGQIPGASLQLTHREITRGSCHMWGCKGYYRSLAGAHRETDVLCPHVLAVLILIRDYLQENPVGDSTDYDAVRLFHYFRGNAVQLSAEDSPLTANVRLVPRLLLKNAGFSLSFRIGKDKLYSVKNMTTFVKTVREHGTMDLGKSASIDFSAEAFDELSQKYFRFICGCVDEISSLADRVNSTYRFVPSVTSEVEIIGSNIDKFFDISYGTTAEYVDRTADKKTRTLRFVNKDPEIKLEIHRLEEKGRFMGIILSGHIPELISGSSAQYFIESREKEAALARISQEQLGKLEPLERLNLHGDIAIQIGRNNLSEFYYQILPLLNEFADVREPDAEYIEAHMPPKAEFAIYLDAVDKLPIGRLEASYIINSDSEEPETFTFDCFLGSDPGRPGEAFRDRYREDAAVDLMMKYFDHIDPEEHFAWIEGGEDRILNLMDNGLREFTAFCHVESTNAFDALRIRRLPKVRIGVSIESDLLNLSISTDDISREELLDILKSYKLKKKYHRLKNGSYVRIEEDMEELAAMVDTLHLSPKEFIQGKAALPAYRALYLDRMLESLDGIYTSRDRHFKQLIRDFKSVKESDFDVPESLAETLRPYQAYGYKWLRVLGSCGFGGILADDMGLGKTLQMIAVLLAVSEEKRAVSLIVCPASLCYNWAEEFARFAPALKVAVAAGQKSEREKLIGSCEEYDVLITSYDLLKRDISFYDGKTFEYQVLDEAQYIKTHTTAAAKSVKVISSRHRFALTGTPIENRLSELWSIFDFLMPGFLYGYDVFRKEIETPIVKNADEAASARLKRMVSPFILRRLKGDVLKDLPEKLEEVRYARFGDEQQKLYDGQVANIRQMLEKSSDDELNQSRIKILAELTRTRQICCDPELIVEHYRGESAKRLACMELIRSAIEGEHRILLFSQFTSMLELLEKDLEAEGIAYFKITGATPKQKRTELVRTFNEGAIPVFLISLKAGGTGLNLTGADVVIHYDPWWNIAAQNQATDRAHRIGQTRTVCVYKLIAQGTIEEKILQMQETKGKLADEILSGEVSGISGMSREELFELLSC